MLIFERVTAQDTNPTSQTREGEGGSSPALRDAYDLFADLCLLTRVQGGAAGGMGSLLAGVGGREWKGEVGLLRGCVVGRVFGLELLESLLGGFEGCLKEVSLVSPWYEMYTDNLIAPGTCRAVTQLPLPPPRPQPHGKILLIPSDTPHHPPHLPPHPVILGPAARRM